MTAPPSSAPPSTADAVNSSQPSSSKSFLTSPTPSSSAIRSPIFSAQPLIGKPINSPAPPPPPPPPSHGILYPVGGSVHRGFPVRSAVGVRAMDQLVTVANPAGYLRSGSPMAVMNFAAAMAAASQARPYIYGGVEHTAAAAAASHGMRRPPLSQGQQQGHHSVDPRPGAARGAPAPVHPKVTSLPSTPLAPEQSNAKESRDKSIDDTFVMIHGRKPNVGDGVKLLPKPLSPSIVEEMLNKKLDGTGVDDFQEDVAEVFDKFLQGSTLKECYAAFAAVADRCLDLLDHGDSVEQLSSQELLADHIRQAKRVRARFRRERLLRIERYKQRLSLLLPAPNDLGQTNTTAGNS